MPQPPRKTPTKNQTNSKKPARNNLSHKHQDRKPKGLHPNNRHHGRYNFEKLEQKNPNLTPFVILNPSGEKTINFSDPKAVLALNESLLKAYYGLDFWQIPDGYLCPPIPGRSDYIHYLADLLNDSLPQHLFTQHLSPQNQPQQQKPQPFMHLYPLLDIGTGANCIYPILGACIHGWHFVATDIDPISVKTAQLLVKANKPLNGKIKVRQQMDSNAIFKGIIKPQDRFAISLCNPPFHESMEKAQQGSLRKVNNLSKGKSASSFESQKKNQAPVLNFSGTQNELCYKGGEIAFLEKMASESQEFAHQVCWFTSLVSKKENVALLQNTLKKLNINSRKVKQVKVVDMAQGQKISRFIAWSFLSKEEQAEFFEPK